MNKKLTACKACGQQIAKSAKSCPHCGAKNKKPIFKKWWFWAIIIILIIASGSPDNTSDTQQTPSNTVSAQPTSSVQDSGTTANKTTEPAKTEYYVGDIIQNGDAKIVFVSSGDYIEENKYSQPTEGNKYIFLEFAVENTSKTSDVSISYYSFECYADGYATEMYYSGDEELSATLSAGRTTTGRIYFEVPVDAKDIEIEYETNIFTEKKIKFIFEGEKDSGYVQQLNTTPTEGAYKVGDIVKSSRLNIIYLSCEEYVSDNMFVVPAEGNHFVTCKFEFENVGTTDEYISSFEFDCYADGVNCKGVYIRDDELSATLSAGRKTQGTVTFEVPINAEVVEFEYLSNYWTSNRVVFTAK